MSDQPEPAAHDHEFLYLELVDPAGKIVSSYQIPGPLPVNRDMAAPIIMQAVIAHADGCSRVIQRAPLPPY